MSGEHTPEELAAMEARLLGNVVELLDLIGDWEDNTQVRKTGMSIHIKWANQIDINDALRVKAMFLNGPSMLEDVLTEIGKLRAAVSEERCPECGSEQRGAPSCGCGWHDGPAVPDLKEETP